MNVTGVQKNKATQLKISYKNSMNNANSKVEKFLNSEKGYLFIKSALKSKILTKKKRKGDLKKYIKTWISLK